MLFSLDVLRARKGDCLLLHYGTASDPHVVIIDGGPRQVYGPHLKPRIEQIRQARGLKKNQPLTVDLLMVSHVDDDHIQGLLDLTRELITAEMDGKPPWLQVLSFWHNSFENIIGSTPTELTATFTSSRFGAAATHGDLPEDLTLECDDPSFDEETIRSTLKVLASIEQGARLRADADRLEFPLNPEFDGQLIMAKKKNDRVDMGDDLHFTVIGPMLPELKVLHVKHQEWLKDLKKKGISPEEALAAYVDKSVPNLSSIVLLAEAGDKRILLTGDARGDKILKGLEFVGLVKKGGTLHVDVLKVPHHGSANNLDDDFFQRITADHYVFSGNGEHGNPEREALEMLDDARGDADYEIHLTYPVAEIDAERKRDWEKEQTQEKKRKETNPDVKVRGNWSPKKHGLTALLKGKPALAKKDPRRGCGPSARNQPARGGWFLSQRLEMRVALSGSIRLTATQRSSLAKTCHCCNAIQRTPAASADLQRRFLRRTPCSVSGY